MAARGLKTKIAFNVALLLLISAIITDILVIVVVQNVMVRDAVEDVQVAARSNALMFLDGHSRVPPQTPTGFDPFDFQPRRLWEYASLVIWDTSGSAVFQRQHPENPVHIPERPLEMTAQPTVSRVEDVGITWAVFWWHPAAVSIRMPLYRGDRLQGVTAARVPLTPIYDKLRNFNKPVFLYLTINTVILTLVGLYRIFRLYLRPIDRIIRQADEFQDDGDLLFAFRQEDDELNRLSMSLNQMLSRISSDKRKLRETVDSLGSANQELQAAQREVISAEKLASVGRLAAGIAHEIGNPIGIVLGYLEMMKDADLDQEERVDFLQRTEKEVQRINTVIRQLLDLARPQRSDTQQVALHQVLHDILDVMRLQPIMRNIRLESALDAQRDDIEGNQDQLRQVFLNLILNAADAIRSKAPAVGGMIKISTQIAGGGETPASPCLRIRIEDNGIGIHQERIQDIFDPFYTTKDPGKGTGLGLSVSYMIIEGFGGTMVAESPGENSGAVFTIDLPLQTPEDPRSGVAEGSQ